MTTEVSNLAFIASYTPHLHKTDAMKQNFARKGVAPISPPRSADTLPAGSPMVQSRGPRRCAECATASAGSEVQILCCSFHLKGLVYEEGQSCLQTFDLLTHPMRNQCAKLHTVDSIVSGPRLACGAGIIM